MTAQTDTSRTDSLVKLDIGGSLAEGESGETFDRVNPYTGQIATTVCAATVNDANRAADAAARALPGWSRTPPSRRRALLLAAADILAGKADELAEIMAAEVGTTAALAEFNTVLSAGIIREAAAMTTQATGQTIPTDRPGAFSMTVRKPIGVCLSIAPWNGPLLLGARSIAYPLAFGNTVVFKASELSPRVHDVLAEAFREAGFPPGVVNVIHHKPADAPAVTAALIEHSAVRHVNFTGSSRVGGIIGEIAARNFKPSLLELGGKNPFIVLDDADLDEAAKAIAFGAFTGQGQACMSTERVIVHDSVADELLRRLVKHAGAMRAGDPSAPDSVLGCVISEQSAARISALVEDAVAAGAVVASGGDRRGTLMDATVLDRVTPKMNIYYDETFGPVTVLIRVADEDEAVKVANDTEYGLSSAVFSSDISRALRIASELDVGMCHINGPTLQDEPQVPFGGVKASGWGRFGGQAVIDEFTTLQWVTIDEVPGHYPPFLT